MTEPDKIFDRYAPMLLRIVESRVNKADVEDIVQDVFLKYCEKTPKFKDRNHEKAWFITVAINMTKSLYRAKEFELRVDMSDETMSECLSDKDFIIRAEQETDFNDRLSRLDPRTKAVLMLYFDVGYNVREIAAMYKTKDYIIKRIIANGKRDFLKIVEKEEKKK